MTLTIAIEGKGIIANADASPDSAMVGSAWNEDGAGTDSFSTDTYLYGDTSFAGAYSNKSGFQYYDIGASNVLDFTSSGSEYGQFIYIWVMCPTIGLLETLANKGLAIRIANSLSLGGNVYRDYTIAGNDGSNGWLGDWKCFVLDPYKEPSASNGTFDFTSVRYMGIWIDTTATAKGDNIFISQIAVGKGLRITGTSGSGIAEAVNYCTDYPNRAWGMLQEREGMYFAQTQLYIGDAAAQSADVDFSDSGRILKFIDSEYWTSGSGWLPSYPISASGITIEDTSSYKTEFSDGIVVGSDNGRSGSVIIGSDLQNVFFDMYGGNNAGSVTALYGTTLRNFRGALNSGNDSDHKFYGASFVRDTQFDPVGGPVIRNCIFSETLDDDAALLWNDNINIQSCKFIANASHAIEHPDYGSFGYTNMEFSGNAYDIYFTDTSGSLVINAAGTSNPDTYETTSGSVIINNTKTYTLQGLIPGTEVRAYVGTNPLTATYLDGVESSGSEFTFYHQEAGNQGYIIMHKEQYVPINLFLTYPNTNTTIPITQRIDYAYDNP